MNLGIDECTVLQLEIASLYSSFWVKVTGWLPTRTVNIQQHLAEHLHLLLGVS